MSLVVNIFSDHYSMFCLDDLFSLEKVFADVSLKLKPAKVCVLQMQRYEATLPVKFNFVLFHETGKKKSIKKGWIHSY